MSQRIQKIGLFDSGVGGLTVLREVYRSAPHLEYFYLGDTARTPYGSKSASTIVRYAEECAEFLRQYEIDLLIVACNTASSYALEHLTKNFPTPVLGTIEPAVQAAIAATKTGVIGVLGTEATINSGVYEQALRSKSPSVTVHAVACPLFVPLVEQGMVAGEIPELVIDFYLSPLRQAAVDVIVLGCTHYPVLRPLLERYFGETVALVECSRAIAAQVAELLRNSSASQTSPLPAPRFFVTDDVARFKRLSKLLLNEEITASEGPHVALANIETREREPFV